jgi:recombination protein RecA
MGALPLPSSLPAPSAAPTPALVALRAKLAEVVARPRADGESAVLPTGIAALDAVLTGGGLPRGRLTELVAAPGSGATTLLWQWVAQALRLGTWAAVIDAQRTLAPADWAAFAESPVWVVHPPAPARAAWCADVLLRSGAFGLVVLDGAPAASRETLLRLTRLAADADAALVLLQRGSAASTPGSALRLAVERPAPDAIAVQVRKGGAPQRVLLPAGATPPLTMPPLGEGPDRRGAAWAAR